MKFDTVVNFLVAYFGHSLSSLEVLVGFCLVILVLICQVKASWLESVFSWSFF